ncbi:J domain-containing protein [Desulfopila sp. IMCC35006]|uniref:J domain-containing protein n=1 Tax=Desulfopila sp. IMCC35006 TaxID=2569542 RepID=UPI001F102E4D|nr:J domain-containing protein [Desulfopila sp. IMCC35006]
MMTKYDEITEARKILDLPERASLHDIRENYIILLNKWHPDKCAEDSENCAEMTRRIITAYKSIIEYCNQHKFSFTEEEIKKTCSVEEWWFERFGNTPWWGK